MADGREGGSTLSDSATFEFSSTEIATFECDLDGVGFAPCVSPQTYGGLEFGSHTFMARATDGAGNTDLTPAAHSWDVLTIKQAIEALQEKVQDLDASFQVKVTLGALLKAAKSLVCNKSKLDDIGGCVILKTFIKRTEQFAKHPLKTGLDSDEASFLIEDATAIRTALGCR